MEHPFKYFEVKVKRFKSGQLITVNHIIYKCTTCESLSGCGICDVLNDARNIHHSLKQCCKICPKCGLFTTFKRLSK